MAEWHLITGEYPPQPGGVSDYTRLVAAGLAAAGDSVHVWCPRSDEDYPSDAGVAVHRELGRMTPQDLVRAGRMLDALPEPRRILVQWVPHAFGFRSANLPLSFWILSRAVAHGDRIDLMIHEPYLPLRQKEVRHAALAIAHRIMLATILRAASHVWVAIPKWEEYCRPYTFGRRIPFTWLPVVSNIPVHNFAERSSFRNRYAPTGRFLIGHFGTCHGEIGAILRATIPQILQNHSERAVLLIGRDSEHLHKRLSLEFPILSDRLHSTGELSSEQASSYISACDVMLQPYPDGVSSRRGSFLAALSHAMPIVTTSGPLTEPLWADGDGIRLVPSDAPSRIVDSVNSLLAHPAERERLGKAAQNLYARRFGVPSTVNSLRGSVVLGALQVHDLPA